MTCGELGAKNVANKLPISIVPLIVSNVSNARKDNGVLFFTCNCDS
jgi:hypothetical protein